MYYGAVQTLAQRVMRYIRRHKLLNPGDRVGVAVSGGADSVALLRLLLELRTELGVVLSVVHFNHKLRGLEADADEQFVADLASRNKLEFRCESGDVAACAQSSAARYFAPVGTEFESCGPRDLGGDSGDCPSGGRILERGGRPHSGGGGAPSAGHWRYSRFEELRGLAPGSTTAPS